MFELSPAQTDRAIGALVGLACGDALGAPYEFQPPVPDTRPIDMAGGGSLAWAPGEWTDDTAMAFAIAEVSASGADLRTDEAQTRIAQAWWTWARDAKDIGVQTRAVLSAARREGTAAALREASERHHRTHGRSGGNGSLMRTAPVALAYLGPDQEDALWQAATAISALTHWEDDAQEACGLWCLAIRHAVLCGNFDGLRQALGRLSAPRQAIWGARLNEAKSKQPFEFRNNGYVVAALQAAWSAIVQTLDAPDLQQAGATAGQYAQQALERAVRCGGDTDTVAAIAGSLIGARWGASAIPDRWKAKLHGWRDATSADLVHLALLSVGQPARP